MRDLANCPVCEHSGADELFPNNFFGTVEQASAYFLTDRQKAVHGRIVRCSHCSFIFTSPQFSAAEYERIYRYVAANEKPAGRNRAVALRYRRLADHVRKWVRGGRFLDFGCGNGAFLDYMPEFQSVGLELRSGDAQAERTKDGRIILSSLHAAIASGLIERHSFDFITAWDVFEHLPDLAGDTQALRSLLKPGGWIFCTVPNVASLAARVSGEKWNCYLLEHLWYFSPKTLGMFFERQGFEERQVRSFLFPADLETLAARIAQTYGITIPVPASLKQWALPLPAGVIFGAFQLKP